MLLSSTFHPRNYTAPRQTVVGSAASWAWSGDLGAWTWCHTGDLSRTPPAYRRADAYYAAVAAARAVMAAAAERNAVQHTRLGYTYPHG